MCMGDLTPVPFRYSPYEAESLNGFIDSNFPRTCRNFDKVRSWVSERNNGSLVVKPVQRADALARARASFQRYGNNKQLIDRLES
jgi:hypothetical protein